MSMQARAQAEGGSPPGRRTGGPRAWAGRLVLGCLLVAVPASANPRFETIRKDGDGLTLESRPAEGTELPELRVRLHAAGSPRELAEVVWNRGPGQAEARFVQRNVLSTRDGVRLERQVVEAPILGRRESVVRFTRREDAKGNVVIAFAVVGPEDGQPAGARRMRVLRGAWRFTLDASGGSWVELLTLSDPGGIPAFLAVGTQRDLAVDLVRDAVLRSAPLAAVR
jgi:hypothetical protein